MTYPPQPGYGPPDPYAQQPGYGPPPPPTPAQQPGYGPGHEPPASPIPVKRPGTVAAAVIFMVLMTALTVLFGLTSFYTILTGMVVGDPVAAVIFAVGYLALGLVILAAAIGVLRGSNLARIAAWVLYSLFILNSLCGAVLSPVFGLPMISVEGAVWGSTVPLLMLFVQVPPMILLALPPTNRWFRAQRWRA